jgi:hypothetical protein
MKFTNHIHYLDDQEYLDELKAKEKNNESRMIKFNYYSFRLIQLIVFDVHEFHV